MRKKRLGVQFPFRHTSVPSDRAGLLIELLRYAGMLEREENLEGTVTTITIWCPLPKDYKHDVWQQQNVERIKSFGIEAVPVERPN